MLKVHVHRCKRTIYILKNIIGKIHLLNIQLLAVHNVNELHNVSKKILISTKIRYIKLYLLYEYTTISNTIVNN